MQSVNQLNASVKLLEIWKALRVEKYPLQINRQHQQLVGTSTRADMSNRPIEIGKSALSHKTCVSDAIRIWNLAPTKVTECESLYKVKREIKSFVKSLPI